VLFEGNVIDYCFTRFSQKEPEWDPIALSKFSDIWLDKDSILYINIPLMVYSVELIKEFQKELMKYKNKTIKAVIIDIRGNIGGNDLTWIKVLENILDITMKYSYCLISNESEDVKKILGTKKQKKIISFECLDTLHSYLIYEQKNHTIKKSRKSLNYDGIIYLLVDADVYSSARGLSSLSTKTDRIKTMGIPTGMLQGQGLVDHAFVLPNSRFIFTLDLLMDAVNITIAEDFYFDKIAYLLKPDIKYYTYWYNREFSSKNYFEELYYQDEVFRIALNIIRKIK
jgi:hypothetical protein